MKWKLIASDLDGTLIQTRSGWERIHKELETWDTKGKKYLEKFLAGKIDYVTFCELDASTWKGVPLTRIHEIAKIEPFLPTVKSTIPILREMISYFYIVSAGLLPFASFVVNELGLDGAIANDLYIDENGLLTGDPIINLEWDEKDKILKKLCTELEIDLSATIALGDGLADIPMFEVAGLSIAVNADLPEVLESATHSVEKFEEIPKIIAKM